MISSSVPRKAVVILREGLLKQWWKDPICRKQIFRDAPRGQAVLVVALLNVRHRLHCFVDSLETDYSSPQREHIMQTRILNNNRSA